MAQPADEPETHHIYRGRMIRLEVDSDRAAVRLADGSNDATRALVLARSGMEVLTNEPIGATGWRMLELRSTSDASDIGDWPRIIADQEAVAFATPVFRGFRTNRRAVHAERSVEFRVSRRRSMDV